MLKAKSFPKRAGKQHKNTTRIDKTGKAPTNKPKLCLN